jgi:hypothetical protein
VWLMGVGGAESKTAVLGGSCARARREEKRGLVRCGVTRGWCSPFIGSGGVGVEMPVSNGRRFTAEPLMAGEGAINGDSRGNQGGE